MGGDVEGQIILNVDDLGERYGGLAFVLPDNKVLPSSAGAFVTRDKKADTSFKASTVPIDPRTGLTTAWTQIQSLYPGIIHSALINCA